MLASKNAITLFPFGCVGKIIVLRVLKTINVRLNKISNAKKGY
jgi:hypothetical protein